MSGVLAVAANAVVSVAYLAVCAAIVVPLVRAGQLRTNRLGASTAAIFLSCAVGHGLHAYGAFQAHAMSGMAGMSGAGHGFGWAQALWDLTTAAVAVNYWTQRRTYGSLMQGAALFEGLEHRRHQEELEHREHLAAARAQTRVEREARRREATRSEETFRAAFDDALVGMCLTTPDGRFLRVNAVFAAMVGRSPADFATMTFREVAHPEEAEMAAAARDRVLTGEATHIHDRRRFRHADGSTVHVDLSSTLVRDEHGAPLHFTAQVVDVTAAELARREREAQEQMLSGVVANSQSLIYVKDLDGRYLLANTMLQRVLGRPEAEFLGRTDADLHAVPDPAWAREDLLTRQGRREVEHRFTRADGEVVVYETVRFPLHDARGALYATCGVSLDVTARRRITEEREAAAAAITRAAEAAMEATDVKARFLATMSHEIRTPMNAVIGMSGLLADTALDEQQAQFVDTIRTSGEALLAVINDVLDFSKLESGELHLEAHPFDLSECLDEVLALVAGDAGHLDLVAHLGDDVPARVRGDSHRLRQVLVNLVGNAVKFTRSGDVLLSVERDPDHATPGQLTFSVRDTGIGIPPEALERVFTSFSQVDASTTRRYGGTGLGLAISRSIVRAMGGDLSVRSEVGRGSEFRFTVALQECPALRDEGRTGAAVADLAGLRALLVDDNETNRRILRLQLTSWGVRCVDFADPAEALRALRGGAPFDVAVLDMHMPGLDGVALASRVRELPHRAQLPMLLLTSLGSRPDAAGAALFAGFHTKPVRSGVLRSVLGDVVSTPPAAAPTAPPVAVPAGPAAAAAVPRGLRVLLAEDNEVNQQVADLMLRKLGHRADVAGDGREALDAVRTGDYDVVLMDLHMPVMDGLEATRAIRALPAGRQPHIIAMTASTSGEGRAACEAAGMDGYLNKPVRLSDLGDALTSAAAARAGGPGAAARPEDGDEVETCVADVGSRLAELFEDGDPAVSRPLRAHLVRSFCDGAPRLAAALADAVRRGDPVALAGHAHELKGAAATVGATAVATRAAAVERAARAGTDVGELGSHVAGLHVLLERLLPQLAPAAGPT